MKIKTEIMKNKKGFTLIELSVVLVVIAVIAGAVVLGGDIVRQFKAASQIKQMIYLKGAALKFTEQYGYLPGDLPNAKTVFGDDFEGDGDKMLDPFEQVNFFSQLTLSGLINEKYERNDFPGYDYAAVSAYDFRSHANIDAPATKYKPQGSIVRAEALGTGVYSNVDPVPKIVPATFAYNYFAFNGVDGSGNYGQMAFITPQALMNIDKKIDDGLPKTGKLLSHPGTNYSDDADKDAIEAMGPVSCSMDDSTPADQDNQYNLAQSETELCQIWYVMD